jgi:hypothetical protein
MHILHWPNLDYPPRQAAQTYFKICFNARKLSAWLESCRLQRPYALHVLGGAQAGYRTSPVTQADHRSTLNSSKMDSQRMRPSLITIQNMDCDDWTEHGCATSLADTSRW